MSTLYELQNHVRDALYKKRLFEVRMKELKKNYEMPALTQLSNLGLDETIAKLISFSMH